MKSILELHAACVAVYAYALASRSGNTENALIALSSSPEGKALIAAIDAAKWGKQADGSFITSQSNAHWIWDSGDLCDLHAPAKQGILASAIVHRQEGRHSLSFFSTREDARAKRDAEKASARAWRAQYEEDLSFAADALWSTGLTWYDTGAFGGTLIVPGPEKIESWSDVNGRKVSARGALARAWGVRCTCGRRAGGHADRLPVVACAACDRADEFGAIADEFRRVVTDDNRHNATITLYADGAYAERDGSAYAWGPTARARAGQCDGPVESRVRDPRAGKFVWCGSSFASERRTSKRIARRATRRFMRAELAQMMAA